MEHDWKLLENSNKRAHCVVDSSIKLFIAQRNIVIRIQLPKPWLNSRQCSQKEIEERRSKTDWLLNESDWQSWKSSDRAKCKEWEREMIKGQESDANSETYAEWWKIFRDTFYRNSQSVYNAKVMIEIMRAIVVDAIEAEWMARP